MKSLSAVELEPEDEEDFDNDEGGGKSNHSSWARASHIWRRCFSVYGICFVSRCLETSEKLVGQLHIIKLGGVEAGLQVVAVRSGWGVVLLLQ